VSNYRKYSEILPELTDEALSNPNGTYRNDIRLALLRLPPEYRQTACVIEYDRNTWNDAHGNQIRLRSTMNDVVREILEGIEDDE